MEIEHAKLDDLTVERLTEPYIDSLAALSDHCVGEGLYPAEQLRAMMDDPKWFVYLVLGPEGELAAYIYFHLVGLREAAAIAKAPVEKFAALSKKAEPVFAQICSVAVADGYRGRGVSRWLLSLAMRYIRCNGLADGAFGTAWLVGGKAAMDSDLRGQGFWHLQDSPMMWYDHPTLHCPVCHGRCRCSAAVYVQGFDTEEHDL